MDTSRVPCPGICLRTFTRIASLARPRTRVLSLEGRRRVWTKRPGYSLLVATWLLSAVAIGCLQPVDAQERVCVANILEFEPGKIRIRNSGGDSVRTESSRIPTPLCVLEVLTDRSQFRVYVPDGEWEGEWFVKRRKVTRIDATLNIECAPSLVTSKVEIRAERHGGTRAIGEEPCD